jgi:hypothetical protein
MIRENSKKIQRSFNTLALIKTGDNPRNVRKILGNPLEKRGNGRIWIYGNRLQDGSYENLLEVFFDESEESVKGIISFDKNKVSEEFDINIGDSIDKLIDIYGEPVDEKDYIEDPDNKQYLGLYYLYPRSGIGFLIGQENKTNNLLVEGVFVFGKK